MPTPRPTFLSVWEWKDGGDMVGVCVKSDVENDVRLDVGLDIESEIFELRVVEYDIPIVPAI